MGDRQTEGRRWWKYKRTWLIGGPGAVILGVAGLFIWGSLQPRPAGFDPDEVVLTDGEAPIMGDEVATAVVDEVAASEDEVTRYTLDATSRDDWVLFDFDTGRVLDGDLSSSHWDMAFRRTKLLTNSGVTNPSGPGGAFDLGDVPLEVASPPESVAFVVDSLGGDDDDEPENVAIGRWYSYSFIAHIVSVKPNTYLVRTGDELDALVQFDSYYCEDEEAGCITFRYRLIPSVAEES
ncbi:MAG: HmuY family protein [Acidimicrobiia bacterium]